MAQSEPEPAERAVEDLRAMGGEVTRSWALAWVAEAYGCSGRAGDALRVLDGALAAAEAHSERYFEAEIHRLKGALLLKQGPGNEAGAELSFLRAIDIARNQQAKWFELRAAVSLGRLWQSQGRREEARALVTGVYDWFTEGFDLIDLQEARALIEELG